MVASHCDCHTRPLTLQRFTRRRRRTREWPWVGPPAVGGRNQRRLLLLERQVQEVLSCFACRDRYWRSVGGYRQHWRLQRDAGLGEREEDQQE